MKKAFAATVVALGVLVAAPAVWAHHSTAMYEMANPTTISGVVKRLEWTNPHAFIYLDVKDDKGAVVEWEIELGPGRPPIRPGPAMMLVRPEALRLTPPGPGAVPATITGRRFVGPSALFQAVTDQDAGLEVAAPAHAVEPGTRVGIMPSRREGGGIHLFPAGET